MCLLMAGVSGAATAPSSDSKKGSAKATATPAATLVATRRLTETQYRHTIADLFGGDIQINGRFEPEKREEGLLAIGGSELSISASGFEQYYAIARNISEQVLNDKRRAKFAMCVPADAKAADDRCVAQFVNNYGRALFRRPLTASEVKPRLLLASEGATKKSDYYAGLKLALTSLLTAPEFLFRIETAEKDPANPNALRLDGYTKAARLSYLFWDTAPDEALLTVAASGEIHAAAGLERQIVRLLASPSMEAGVRAFFTDMLQFELFETLTKDAAIYPKFSQEVAESAKEQTLRTLVDQLIVKNGSYVDLFTTRDTFINRPLASIYQVPFVAKDGWRSYTFAKESDQSGLLTQLSFVSLFSHPGRSSPTKRGAALREVFMCDPTPLPPANVDFSIVNDTKNPTLKTVRSRLLAHAEDDACRSCHLRSDPIGLSLERFDSLAQHRITENGDPIDVTAELEGRKFEGAQGLGEVMRANPRIPACLVRNVYAYGVGRAPSKEDKSFLDKASADFAQDGYRVPAMLRRVASSPDFFKLPAPESAAGKGAQSAAAP